MKRKGCKSARKSFINVRGRLVALLGRRPLERARIHDYFLTLLQDSKFDETPNSASLRSAGDSILATSRGNLKIVGGPGRITS